MSVIADELCQNATGRLRVNEGDLETEQATPRCLVDQFDPVRPQARELGTDVGRLEREMVHPRTALCEEPSDRCLGAERSEQLDAGRAHPQRGRFDTLVLEALAVLERGAEERRPARDPGVEVVDRDPDVVNRARQDTTSSTVAMRTPPPRHETTQAFDRSSSMPHAASSTKVTLCPRASRSLTPRRRRCRSRPEEHHLVRREQIEHALGIRP
jgi:hypothetical protein